MNANSYFLCFHLKYFFLLLRPKCYAEDREDKDIYEILDIVSPPRSPNSKAKTPPSKNSLFDELKTKEVYQDNFLEELQAKYDTRKKDREVLIKEEEVKAKYSRFVFMKYRSHCQGMSHVNFLESLGSNEFHIK